MTVAKPASRPNVPHFSSGPCAKRPGWNAQNLKDAALGRSHRAKVGNDYVVQADDKCILKVGSRRRAAQLISEATDLLNALAAAESPEKPVDAPSLAREAPELP